MSRAGHTSQRATRLYWKSRIAWAITQKKFYRLTSVTFRDATQLGPNTFGPFASVLLRRASCRGTARACRARIAGRDGAQRPVGRFAPRHLRFPAHSTARILPRHVPLKDAAAALPASGGGLAGITTEADASHIADAERWTGRTSGQACVGRAERSAPHTPDWTWACCLGSRQACEPGSLT